MSPNAWAALVAILGILIAVGFGWLIIDLCSNFGGNRCPHKSYTGIAGCRVCDDCGQYQELVEVTICKADGTRGTILVWQEID